ncbi:MAG: 4Fe-4S binding protein [Nitrososphaeria archaeon]
MRKITAISDPSEGVIGKTGSWRLKKPVINRQKCTRCLICWIFCPDGSILRKDNDYVDIDYDYCKGCGVCSNECPSNAINMVEE